MAHVATVTIDATHVTATLTDFPVFVDLADLDATVDFWDTVANNGGDIRVYKDDGSTELAREVVACLTASNTGELWFLADSISSSADTVFHIYADGSSSEPASDATYGSEAVWGNYDVVSHDGGTTDSSGNSYVTATGVGAATGKVGADAGDYASTDYSTINNAVGSNLGDCTVSFWLKTSQTSEGDPIYGRNTGNNQISAMQYNRSGTSKSIRLFWRDIDGNRIDAIETTPTANWNNNAWHLHQHAIEGTTNTWGLYLDGAAETPSYSTTTTPDNWGAQNSMMIGRRSDVAQDYLSGDYDEIRIRTSVITAAWAAAEYTNQNAPTTFYTATGGSTPPATAGFSQAVVIM